MLFEELMENGLSEKDAEIVISKVCHALITITDSNWKDKIFYGMHLIKEGCMKNEMWTNCNECPFTNYCDMAIEKYGLDASVLPSDWFEKE